MKTIVIYHVSVFVPWYKNKKMRRKSIDILTTIYIVSCWVPMLYIKSVMDQFGKVTVNVLVSLVAFGLLAAICWPVTVYTQKKNWSYETVLLIVIAAFGITFVSNWYLTAQIESWVSQFLGVA